MSDLYIADSSFILKHLLRDEQNAEVDDMIQRFIKKEVQILSPEILGVEVANALRSAVLRKRITEAEANVCIGVFTDLEIEQVGVPFDTILQTSFKLNISCYDAVYAALAKEKGAKLLTFDGKLEELISGNDS